MKHNVPELTESAERLLRRATALSSKAEVQALRSEIVETKNEANLFPLMRAIDFILTGDPAHVEKLTPEVKGITEIILGMWKKQFPPDDWPKPVQRPRRAAPRRKLHRVLGA